jgi:8-oxo-dGTP pyrophosphatase MutT (NUDIX family)
MHWYTKVSKKRMAHENNMNEVHTTRIGTPVKREVSLFVPFKKTSAGLLFFLQKRDALARSNSGMLGLFGGGKEHGETPHDALLREVNEELTYTPSNPVFFSRFESSDHVSHVFFEEVDDTFESKVVVREGEYGVFLPSEQILHVPEISLFAQFVIYSYLKVGGSDVSSQNHE